MRLFAGHLRNHRCRCGWHLRLVELVKLIVEVLELGLDGGLERVLADDGDAELAAGDPVVLAAVEVEVVLDLDEVFKNVAGLEVGVGELCQVPGVDEFVAFAIDGATGFSPGHRGISGGGNRAVFHEVDDPVVVAGRLGGGLGSGLGGGDGGGADALDDELGMVRRRQSSSATALSGNSAMAV